MIGARSSRIAAGASQQEKAEARLPALVGGSDSSASTRTEAVREALRQAIVGRKLEPGARLRETAIGEAFGVSRTIVREAFGRLAGQGLVELKPNRGAFVANPGPDEGKEAFVVCRGLERTIAECLAGRLTLAQANELKAFVAREGGNGTRATAQSVEFRLLLARLTGNQTLIRYVEEILSRCALVLAARGRSAGERQEPNRHQAIVDALVDGDASKAARLMDEGMSLRLTH